MAWVVILPLRTLIYPTPYLSTPQIKISLARFRMLSAHTYHGYLDDPPSEPFSVALFLSLLNAREDAIPPLDARICRPLVQQCKVVLFPHLTARLPQFAASPQRPHHPRFTTSLVTGWRNVPSFLACAMKLELWAICNLWPLPWD